MAPGGRDKNLCDCLASTLRKGGGGRREGGDGKWCQNVTSQSLTPVPPEGSMSSPDSTTIWRPRVQTHDLWGTIHIQAATVLERQLIGEVGKKGPPLEPALRAFAFEWQEGNDKDPRQAEKQTESQAILGLREMCLWSQYCDCCVGFKLVQILKLKKKYWAGYAPALTVKILSSADGT